MESGASAQKEWIAELAGVRVRTELAQQIEDGRVGGRKDGDGQVRAGQLGAKAAQIQGTRQEEQIRLAC